MFFYKLGTYPVLISIDKCKKIKCNIFAIFRRNRPVGPIIEMGHTHVQTWQYRKIVLCSQRGKFV